ncbi:hypothetical protein, partial [Streptomyces gulbargensis]
MQHISLETEINVETVRNLLKEMISKELLTEEQAGSVDPVLIAKFFESGIGERMVKAPYVYRELPFSFALPIEKVNPLHKGAEEKVLIQGIIDCLFEDANGVVLVDFKSDTITGKYPNGFEQARPELVERYQTQIDLYKTAVENILA